MNKSILTLSMIIAMLVFAPSVILAQTEVGVESEAKVEVGVKTGSESESSSSAEGEAESESETESSEKSQEHTETKSQSSAESETKSEVSLGNLQVTTVGNAAINVGLPVKYPMPAVSASNSFVLQTNQHLYKPGDTITVEGSLWADLLTSLSKSDTVTIKLLDKQRNVIHETDAQITSDGKFSAEFMMPNNAAKGTYTITTLVDTDADLSGIVDLKGKTNLETTAKVAVVPPQVFKINVENHGDFDVKVATNSTLNDVKFNGDQKKVSVTVEGESGTKGVTQISIPKDMVSGNLTVMIDGKAVASDKIVVTHHTDVETEVEVNYMHSVHTIDVIGTQAVPEFGTVAILILTVAILSIVAISYRTKLSLMPNT